MTILINAIIAGYTSLWTEFSPKCINVHDFVVFIFQSDDHPYAYRSCRPGCM